MSSRKTLPGMTSHSITRSEFEDGILRDNARFDNRLNNEKRHVEKAKRVVVREYDKESQMLKQKMASAAQRKATSYYSQTSVPNGTTGKSSGSRVNTGRSTRLIPDYEYKQYRLRQNSDQNDVVKQTTIETKPEKTSKVADDPPQQQNDADVTDGKHEANGKTDFDLPDEYVSTRRTRPPENFWSNLSAPKHHSTVRNVRERLAKEFGKPKSKPSSQRPNGTGRLPLVQGTRMDKK
ncbi:uncharacterized protein LOC124147865 [Haliotis rufescens]|uniref:uncharacterized protein LOC124147865 n=1 Tax=Haliotis rufescens TaxID=6454 RepID=UPI001EAFA76F|nr:uncharacterized protein LOC124147865 [Haliotis rufescens]XP_046374625.1 uncharacterized protein LOC124147865 [Haliotis rufescens]XP_046374626.1 uncharacterized protein LOC124147865 [Haliotis rufescens]XP_046374627.1 uncharacterized protein LOC124147865 [Haliotis rufescens]XP_046374628.1 uncharacterized protein LOC124147865 [Haliotis rufescens]XP_046374630.1 uncharacterized protein LOC124147865 [Haliotis rufescens]